MTGWLILNCKNMKYSNQTKKELLNYTKLSIDQSFTPIYFTIKPVSGMNQFFAKWIRTILKKKNEEFDMATIFLVFVSHNHTFLSPAHCPTNYPNLTIKLTLINFQYST